MKQSGLGKPAAAIGSGFSTATKSALAFKHFSKNFRACIILSHRSLLTSPCCLRCTELTLHRYVHGGWAIIKCHLLTRCFLPSCVRNVVRPSSIGVTSPGICQSIRPPYLHNCRSQLNALNPCSLNAMHSACDSSHAIRIFISDFFII